MNLPASPVGPRPPPTGRPRRWRHLARAVVAVLAVAAVGVGCGQDPRQVEGSVEIGGSSGGHFQALQGVLEAPVVRGTQGAQMLVLGLRAWHIAAHAPSVHFRAISPPDLVVAETIDRGDLYALGADSDPPGFERGDYYVAFYGAGAPATAYVGRELTIRVTVESDRVLQAEGEIMLLATPPPPGSP